MGKNKWTRNQRILLAWLVVASIGLIINTIFLIATYNKQTIINQDLNEFTAKLGEFDQLITSNFSVNSIKLTCPPGTEIDHGFWKGGNESEIGVTCKNISVE